MKLTTWMQINRIKSTKAARLFGITHSHVYKYAYEDAIPRRDLMAKIFLVTRGAVSANDFYGTTDEFLEIELLKQAEEQDKLNNSNDDNNGNDDDEDD